MVATQHEVKENKLVPLTLLFPHERNVAKLAPQAGSWYNRGRKKLSLSDVISILRHEHNLVGGYAMDTLSPHTLECNIVFIYALLDPETKEIRYIGKSINPQLRLKRHYNEKHKSYKNHWIRSLVSRGLAPDLIIIEEVPVSKWQERECYWIAYYRDLGYALVNGTDGGDGVHGRKRTADEKARISASLIGNQRGKGYKPTPEQQVRKSAALMGHAVRSDTREKIAATKRGKQRSPETVAKVSASLTGRKMSEEQVAKMRGRKQSAESQAKRSASLKLTLSTPEARAKKSQASKGRVMSESTREKLRVINTGRKHTQEQREANRERALRLGLKPPSRKGVPMPPESVTKRLETNALRNQEKIQRQYVLGDNA